MPARHKRHSSSHYLLPRSAHRLRDITGRKHALFTGRGAAGIVAALRVFGLRDEVVLLPANTCYVVLWAVLRSGNKPLLVDVDSATGNLSADVLPQQTDAKAIIPCHMYGLGAPIEDICAWARERDVHVVEDAALALGATADGRPAGSWGDVSIFSFGLGKIADNQLGGVMLTDDDVLTKEIGRLLAEMPPWDDDLMALTNQWNAIYWALHQYEADNPQLPQLYPALYELYGGLTAYRLPSDDWDDLPELLNGLPANLEHRAKLAARYDELLNLTPQPPLRQQRGGAMQEPSQSVWTLPRPKGSILWKYPLLVMPEHRNELLQYLWENGIQDATRWYPSLRTMTVALTPDVSQPPTPNADSSGRIHHQPAA